MLLRKNPRPPQRYDSEVEFPSTTRRRRCQRNASARPAITYADFDPNHPPAAFPTLDQPVPAGQTSDSSSSQTPSSDSVLPRDSRDGSNDKTDAMDLDEDQDQDLFPHISPEHLDNFIASNGTQNPQYRRNMELLSREEDSEIEFSSEDEDGKTVPFYEYEGEYREEDDLPDNPKWYDLPLSLRIEIAQNMMENHSLPRVGTLLGLNACDVEQLAEKLNKQNEDIEHENKVLEETLAKQLKALTRLDNSDLKQHAVPARLIMSRKSWTQCHRAIQKKSKMRYLLCEAGDLLLARRYLSKRGLPMTYAGDWGNQYVVSPTTSNTTGVPEDYQWKDTIDPPNPPNPPPEPVPVAANVDNEVESRPSPEPSDDTEDSSDVQYAPSRTGRNQRRARSSSRRGRNIISRRATRGNSNWHFPQLRLTLPRRRIVRLNIGKKNAARLLASQQPAPSHVQTSVNEMTHNLRQRNTVREPNSDDTIEQSPSAFHNSAPWQGHSPSPQHRHFGMLPTASHHYPPLRPRLPSIPEGNLNDAYGDLSISQQLPGMNPYRSTRTVVRPSTSYQGQTLQPNTNNGLATMATHGNTQAESRTSIFDQYPLPPIGNLASIGIYTPPTPHLGYTPSGQGAEVNNSFPSHLPEPSPRSNGIWNRELQDVMAPSTSAWQQQMDMGVNSPYVGGFEDAQETPQASYLLETLQYHRMAVGNQEQRHFASDYDEDFVNETTAMAAEIPQGGMMDWEYLGHHPNPSRGQEEGETKALGEQQLTALDGVAGEMIHQDQGTRPAANKKKATENAQITDEDLPATQPRRRRRTAQPGARGRGRGSVTNNENKN